eukprot:3708900-Rhodomonas_salina.1
MLLRGSKQCETRSMYHDDQMTNVVSCNASVPECGRGRASRSSYADSELSRVSGWAGWVGTRNLV